jgi:hypothetical protein
MKKQFHKRTWIKILIGVSALLIIIIISNTVLKSVVEKKLRTSLQQFQPYIRAGFTEAHVNLFASSIQLDSLYVLYNPELKQQHKHELYFSAVSISGIHFFKLITAKDFSAGSLQLKNANIIIDSYLFEKKDTLPPGIFNQVNMPFKNISFSSVELNDVKIFEKNNDKKDAVCNGSILLSDLQIPAIDSAFSKDSIRFSSVKCDMNDVHYALPGYYAVHLKRFHLDSKDSVMQLDSLKLLPLLGKFELGEKLGRQADHINATVNTIDISGLHVKELIQKKFIATEINIKNVTAYVFRDRRLPHSKDKQPMPLDYLKQIPFDLNVLRFNLKNATITSEEFPKEGAHSGYIKLEHLSMTMKPFINHPTKGSAFITSNVQASIMGAGNIQATINLSVLNGSSQIKGAINDLNLPAMNPSAENLGEFHVQSGVLNRLDFQFTATNTKATGEIVGEYHDLVIDKLKYTEHGLEKAKLPSFLLHHIIIPKDKDASLDIKKRTGKIDYDRDPTRLVTFYYLKALLDGIRDSFTLGFVLPG